MSSGLATTERIRSPIPARAGVGLKPEYYWDILETSPDIGWFEVHPENYMADGGISHYVLERVRARYPLSLHGVGLSIGATSPLDQVHLARLKTLVDRYDPGLVSEHLAWSTHDGAFLNDLLPLPYTTETLDLVARHVDEMQSALRRQVLIENPSTYVAFAADAMSEVDFLRQLAKRTGCGLLLDCNNVFVSAVNHGRDPYGYIREFPIDSVGEFHLAGHAEFEHEDGGPLLIDAHDRSVSEIVWDLFRVATARTGAMPTLIEWDNDIPPWAKLHDEAILAENILSCGRQIHVRAA
jgi:uncharacterized protein (UPF0276 family)